MHSTWRSRKKKQRKKNSTRIARVRHSDHTSLGHARTQNKDGEKVRVLRVETYSVVSNRVDNRRNFVHRETGKKYSGMTDAKSEHERLASPSSRGALQASSNSKIVVPFERPHAGLDIFPRELIDVDPSTRVLGAQDDRHARVNLAHLCRTKQSEHHKEPRAVRE